ncbi:MAG: hypothetical protein WC838_02665 [Candidatus Margulisiibacteriota bacterium]|jgi:hypothetical protein
MFKKIILTKQPFAPSIDSLAIHVERSSPLICCDALEKRPWRKALGLPFTQPINKDDIMLAAAVKRLPRNISISDWPIFLVELKKAVSTSALAFDIDGTLLQNQSQVSRDELKGLRSAHYQARLKLLFEMIACGFPVFFVSASSLERQKELIVDPLVEHAAKKGLLPALSGVGLFASTMTRFASLDSSGNFVEDPSYNNDITLRSDQIRKLEKVIGNYLNSFRFKSRTGELNARLYPGFKAKPVALQNDQDRRLLIHPLPSWRYNWDLFRFAPQDRQDLRSMVIQELKEVLDRHGLLEGLNVSEGGNTTIDITSRKVNKTMPVKHILDKIARGGHLMCVGDEYYPGGNDMPIIDYMNDLKSHDPHFNRISVFVLNHNNFAPRAMPSVFTGGSDEKFCNLLMELYLSAYNNMIFNTTLSPIGRSVHITLNTLEALTKTPGTIPTDSWCRFDNK